MAIEVKLRKWGNSIGVILPKELISKKNLKEDQTIVIEVVKKADLTRVFGSLKNKKHISGQQFKEIAREGWE